VSELPSQRGRRRGGGGWIRVVAPVERTDRWTKGTDWICAEELCHGSLRAWGEGLGRSVLGCYGRGEGGTCCVGAAHSRTGLRRRKMGDLWRTKGVREEIEAREVQDDWMREVTRVNKLGRKERNPCTGGSHESGSFNKRGFIYLPMFTDGRANAKHKYFYRWTIYWNTRMYRLTVHHNSLTTNNPSLIMYFYQQESVVNLGLCCSVRRCIPTTEGMKIIKKCHATPYGGHYGTFRTHVKIWQSGFFWPTMYHDTRDFIQKCRRCQMHGGITI
jgi:hypothetical protein